MYHRPGLGQSELGEEIRNTEATVQDVHQLLTYFEIDEPVYLVGHSYGGLCAQHFAKMYPERIAGMVLVDSTSIHLERLDELDLPVLNEESDEKWVDKCLQYAAMDKEQLRTILNPSLNDHFRRFPDFVQQRLLEFQINPLLYKAMASEILNWKRDAERIKELGDFPNIPLIIIGRDKEWTIRSEMEAGIPEWELRCFENSWEELIIEQAKLSTDSVLIFAERSGHAIYLDRPDCVIASINSVVRKGSF